MATKKSSVKRPLKSPIIPAKATTKAAPRTTRKATTLTPIAPKPITVKAMKMASRISFASLRKWNLSLAVLHAVQGIAVLLLSTAKGFPISSSYLTKDPLQTAAQGKPVLALATEHIVDINLAYVVAAFFFLSAIAHLFVATRHRKAYETEISRGQNRTRWIEYALSASTMMFAIGLLVGVQDSALLLTLFGLTAVMNLCGLVMETHNVPGQPVKWLSYVVGSIAGIIPWLVIAIYLIGSAVNGGGTPAFVYWIFGSMFILFTTFAVNMWLQYKHIGKWSDYRYGERVYMLLSLIAKSVLAWQVFAGALRP